MCVNSMCMLVRAHPWISEIFVSCAHILSKWCHVGNKGTDDWYIVYVACCHPEKSLCCLCIHCVCVIMCEYTCWDTQEYLLSNVGKCVFHSLFFPFHSLSSLLSNHTLLIKGVLFISWSHYPVTFLYFSDPTLRFFTPPSYSFSFTSSTSVSTWWVSSHFPPSLLAFLSVSAIIFMFEITLSYFPVQTHTWTLCHAPAEECACHLHPPTLPPFLHTFLPHFFTSSFMLSPLSSPLFRLPQSLSIPLHLSVSDSKPESL